MWRPFQDRQVGLHTPAPLQRVQKRGKELVRGQMHAAAAGSCAALVAVCCSHFPVRHEQVVAYDYGIKHNILRRLASMGCRVTVVPADYPAKKVLEMKPDGIFLSNGPVRSSRCPKSKM